MVPHSQAAPPVLLPRHAGAGASPAWALRLAVERGLLQSADFFSGAPVAEELSISHRSFLIRVAGRPRWFIKRADPVRTGGRDLGVEAAVYRLAVHHPEIARVIPRCRLIGEGGGLLVLDAVDGYPLNTLTFNSPGDSGILEAYGRSVAAVHQVRPAPFGQPPWLLVALEARWAGYSWLPRGCAALFRRLAASRALRTAFQDAHRRWRPRCLTHGDIRWANAVAESRDQTVRVWLVDWELACLGDPAWDVGSLIADALATKALLSGTEPAMEDWARMCTPILAGYRAAARPFPTSVWAEFVEQSVQLAGMRLVQSIIEHGHASSQDLQRAEAALLPSSLRFLLQSRAVGRGLARASEVAF